jgi:hypothetical protein
MAAETRHASYIHKQRILVTNMYRDFTVEIGDPSAHVQQKDEFVEVSCNGESRRIWLHDYDEIYRVQGLYEAIFIDLFKGVSHVLVPDLLQSVIAKEGIDPVELRVLDFGAGVGLAGESLNRHGVRDLLGIDVTEQGRIATMRDRAGIYRDYIVADMSAPSPDTVEKIRQFAPTSLICVSSLNVIPVTAWAAVYRAIPINGLVAFNILAGALADTPPASCMNGSNALIRHLLNSQQLEVKESLVYRHRLNSAGGDVMYTAVVGRKLRELSESEAQQFLCPSW